MRYGYKEMKIDQLKCTPPPFSNVRLNRNSENNIEAIRPSDPILNVLDTGYLWYGKFNTFQKGPFNSHKWDIYVFISLNQRYGTCLIVALCRCFIDWNCFLGETYDPWALFCCWGEWFYFNSPLDSMTIAAHKS